MATLNVRIDDNIKNEALGVLQQLNISQSEAVRLFFEYIALHKKLPIKSLVVEDDADLVALVKQRLANPEPSFAVNLDDL